MKLTHVDNAIEALHNQIDAAEMALRPNGVLNEVAAQIARPETGQLTPDEAADILLPQKDSGTPRWELVDNAGDLKRTLIDERAEEVFMVATAAGMRQDKTLPRDTLSELYPDISVCVVESGANRTPLIRPEIARQIIDKAGLDRRIWEPVGDRVIPRLRSNGSINPEHAIAREIAPNLPGGDITEFDIKKAVIETLGYREFDGPWIDERSMVIDGLSRAGVFYAPYYDEIGEIDNRPDRFVLQPLRNKERGLQAGLTATHNILKESDLTNQLGLAQKFLVLVTNGQYRTKIKMHALEWAKKHEIPLRGVTAFGDEAGFTVNHLNRQYVTAERGPMVYANEIVVIHRLGQRLLSLGS